MNDTSKSILAKLLAKENITVQHGKYPTAFFDVDNRILGLPLWKEMNKDVYDLMIGHEVGHALETPSAGWHDSKFDVPGCPRAFINIIEDIRIEKLIQRRYPGLVASFKRGYNYLLNENDFFGIKDQNVNEMSFMNRLNLKSKLRDLIEINFSAEEQPYVNMAMAVETWDDVIRVCRAIFEYLKQKEKNDTPKQAQGQQQEQSRGNNEESFPEDSEESGDSGNEDRNFDEQSSFGNDQHSSDQDDSLDSTEDNDDSVSVPNVEDRKDDQDITEEQEKEPVAQSGGNDLQDVFDTSTDDAHRKNEELLIERDVFGDIPTVINGINRQQLKDIIVPYSTIAKSRREKLQAFDFKRPEYYDIEYKKFFEETSKIVGVMVKEFEMRKAAYQYARAKTSRTGALNVNKLHEYKFSDDIFRKVTKLADAKSHGMIMLIDHSGSMESMIGDVIKQTLTLAMFCKKVGIPFDVYSFSGVFMANNKIEAKVNTYDIIHENIKMCQLLSSSLSRSDYEEGFKTLFYKSRCRFSLNMFSSDYETLGSTPSVQVMSAMPIMLKDFRAKHGVQKVIVPVLTDGAPSPVSFKNSQHSSASLFEGVINVGGKYIKGRVFKMFEDLCNNIRSKDTIVVGYYLANTSVAFKKRAGYAAQNWSPEHFKKVMQNRRTNKFVSYDNALGCDRYFVVSGGSNDLSTDIDEFKISENARAGEITRAFKKYTNSKRTNRVFAMQFAEIIS